MMEVLSSINWVGLFYSAGIVILGLYIAKRASNMVDKAVTKRFSKHQAMISQRLVFYGLLIIFLISALQQMGFKMTVLLGAAGVFTVALSFASQTAVSNLVSGIFLLFECPFKVGDLISVKGNLGTVDAIDLLSTKIITPDNTLVRIPNETIMKSEILNMHYFKRRRVEIFVGVSYSSNIEQVKKLLLAIADEHEKILKDPAPVVIINDFADSSIELKFMFWAKSLEAFGVRNALRDIIKEKFDAENIEIPFPQLTVHIPNTVQS